MWSLGSRVVWSLVLHGQWYGVGSGVVWAAMWCGQWCGAGSYVGEFPRAGRWEGGSRMTRQLQKQEQQKQHIAKRLQRPHHDHPQHFARSLGDQTKSRCEEQRGEDTKSASSVLEQP